MYESMHNEVKRKMIETVARNVAPKSHEQLSRAENLHTTAICSPTLMHCVVRDCVPQETRRCIALLYRTAVIGIYETSLSIPPSIMKDDFQRRVACRSASRV